MNRDFLKISPACFLLTILLMAVLNTVIFDLQISQLEKTILASLTITMMILNIIYEVLQKEDQEKQEEEEEERERDG